jgi:serine protease Do
MRNSSMIWTGVTMAALAVGGTHLWSRSTPAAQEVPAAGQQVAQALSDAFNAVAESAAPSVVQIEVEKRVDAGRMFPRGGGGQRQLPDGEMPKELEEMLKRFFGQDGQMPRPNQEPQRRPFQRQQFVNEGTGSGFVYDDKGHILTNAHVVDGADKILVGFHDGVELPARLVGLNSETDVAVIKVDTTEYKPLKLGDSNSLKVGQWVLALGSPFGLDHTVTAGIISATERQEVGINQFESFIQTDAAINPGNSGGPLVDLNGRVVGVNSAIATSTRSNAGVGFAIPINMATRVAEKLIKDGKVSQALMGIEIDPLTPKLARQFGLNPRTKGLVVTRIGEETPAARAGLKAGDVILSFDKQPVRTRQGLQYLVTTSEIGQSYPVEVLREGAKTTLQVAPAAAESVVAMMPGLQRNANRDRAEPAAPKPAPAVASNAFGFEAQPLNAELAEKYGWDNSDPGLVITKVDPDGPAAMEGMEEGDRITQVIRDRKITPVRSLEDLQGTVKDSKEIAVFVEDVRKQAPGRFMTLSTPEGDQPRS